MFSYNIFLKLLLYHWTICNKRLDFRKNTDIYIINISQIQYRV